MNHATFFSPRLRLLLLALICNLALSRSFIGWVANCLSSKNQNDTLWRIAIMWLGLLGGRVFGGLCQFAQLRNCRRLGCSLPGADYSAKPELLN